MLAGNMLQKKIKCILEFNTSVNAQFDCYQSLKWTNRVSRGTYNKSKMRSV